MLMDLVYAGSHTFDGFRYDTPLWRGTYDGDDVETA